MAIRRRAHTYSASRSQRTFRQGQSLACLHCPERKRPGMGRHTAILKWVPVALRTEPRPGTEQHPVPRLQLSCLGTTLSHSAPCAGPRRAVPLSPEPPPLHAVEAPLMPCSLVKVLSSPPWILCTTWTVHGGGPCPNSVCLYKARSPAVNTRPVSLLPA